MYGYITASVMMYNSVFIPTNKTPILVIVK